MRPKERKEVKLGESSEGSEEKRLGEKEKARKNTQSQGRNSGYQSKGGKVEVAPTLGTEGCPNNY